MTGSGFRRCHDNPLLLLISKVEQQPRHRSSGNHLSIHTECAVPADVPERLPVGIVDVFLTIVQRSNGPDSASEAIANSFCHKFSLAISASFDETVLPPKGEKDPVGTHQRVGGIPWNY